MSVVLDIDVVVDGCRPDGGASYELMVRIARGKLKTYCSPELHADYRVALQGAVQRREVRLSSTKATQLLDSFSHFITSVDIQMVHIAEILVEAGAEAAEFLNVVATARSGKVDMIVTNRPDKVRAVLKSGAIKIVRPEDMI